MSTSEAPKGNPIELVKYSDDSREVILTLVQFNELEKSANETHGMGLAQLAMSDPQAMYRLFQIHLEAIAINSYWVTISVNGEQVAKDAMATQSELTSRALAHVRAMPDSSFEEFDLKISVYPTELDIEFFGASEPVEIINIHVAPPNLAY